MERVPVTAEAADHQAALLDRAEQRPLLACIAEQHVGIAVGVTRIVARAELDGVEPERGDTVQHRLETEVREEHCEDSELHREIEPRRPWTPSSEAPHQRCGPAAKSVSFGPAMAPFPKAIPQGPEMTIGLRSRPCSWPSMQTARKHGAGIPEAGLRSAC